MAHFKIENGPKQDELFLNFAAKKAKRRQITFMLRSELDGAKGKTCQIAVDIIELRAIGEDRVSFAYQGKITHTKGITDGEKFKYVSGRYSPSFNTGTLSVSQ